MVLFLLDEMNQNEDIFSTYTNFIIPADSIVINNTNMLNNVFFGQNNHIFMTYMYIFYTVHV